MHRTVIKIGDFTRLAEADKADVVRGLARDAMRAPNGEMKLIEARIRSFERRYEMTSERMEQLVADGKFSETAEVASWLIALDLQRRVLGGKARP